MQKFRHNIRSERIGNTTVIFAPFKREREWLERAVREFQNNQKDKLTIPSHPCLDPTTANHTAGLDPARRSVSLFVLSVPLTAGPD